MAAQASRSLEAKCACGSIHFTFDVPVSLLPLSSYLCHCSLCRYATGVPSVFHSRLPRGMRPRFIAPSTEEKLTSYQPAQDCTYDFCSTCGCHVAGVSLGDRSIWAVATSIFVDNGPENFRIEAHYFSKSAPGSAIPAALGQVAQRHLEYDDPPDDDPRAKVNRPSAEVGPRGEERLRAQCHCGGVSFTIGRPDHDMLGDEFVSRFVPLADKSKWMALLDMCDDCRLVNGAHIAGWATVARSACDPPVPVDLKIGTSNTYVSSQGVLRSFCGTCGATVFYSCDAGRGTGESMAVDIATGILRCPDGVMGDGWLLWRARLAYEESGLRYDRALCEALREGMKTWSMEKYGRVLEFQTG